MKNKVYDRITERIIAVLFQGTMLSGEATQLRDPCQLQQDECQSNCGAPLTCKSCLGQWCPSFSGYFCKISRIGRFWLPSPLMGSFYSLHVDHRGRLSRRHGHGCSTLFSLAVWCRKAKL